jgi:HD-like signal output (HDOD) protein
MTVSELVKVLPATSSVRPGMAYLAGLLHNFGFLLLGHQFPDQYDLLSRCLAANPHLPAALVERYVLGAEHPHIGAWLMQSWKMPEELLAAVRWHHSEDIGQPHSEYPNLVLIANRLLFRRNIGDEDSDRLPPTIMSSLGLNRKDVESVMAKIAENSAELDNLSRQLSS